MNVYGAMHYESVIQRMNKPNKIQGEQAGWLAPVPRPRGTQESSVQRMAVRLGDVVAEVRCQLQSRFASEPVATAC